MPDSSSTAAGTDIIEETFANAVTAGTKTIFCFHTIRTTSDGFWMGDNPFNCSFPALLFQIIIVFVACRVTHATLRRISQPLHISQLLAGMLFGTSVLGQNNKLRRLIYAPQSFEQLYTVAILANTFFYFMVGVKADLGLIPKVGKKAIAIALLGTLLPVASVVVTAVALGQKIPNNITETHLLLVLIETWSLTSFSVLSTTLSELNLLTSKLGRLAMSAALIGNFLHLFAEALISIYLLSIEMGSPGKGFVALCAFFALAVFILYVMRPVALWLIRRTPDGAHLGEGSVVAVLVMALGSGLLSELIGFGVSLGPFFFGLVLPGGAPLGVTMEERMERFVMGAFLPLTQALAGMRMNLPSVLADPRHWALFEMLVMMMVVSKFVGAILPCIYCKMPHRDTVSLGLMMICKGIYETGLALNWQDLKIVDDQYYTMLLVTIVSFGGGIPPLIKYLYRPEDQFVANKRRTLQHAKPDDELRVLACVHQEEDVNPILSLVEATGPSNDAPICIYLLHLTQLVGRADAVLHPHKLRCKPSDKSFDASSGTETDHIVNAFRLFKQEFQGAVSVIPYICISPYSAMHNDVCGLALEKKVTLVILPFHKNTITDSTVSSTAIQAVNKNVLQYVPCSVGILVDNGLANVWPLPHRVAVYFLGGADDREALAYGVRMARFGGIELTLVRFLPPWREEDREDTMDERMVKQFQLEMVDDQRVAYREVVVKGGEEMVALIREMSPRFSLLVVGRRAGKESLLTVGLSMWSEYPELGVIGDLLASANFGGQVSTLVVQQQGRVKGAVVQLADSPKSSTTTTNLQVFSEDI